MHRTEGRMAAVRIGPKHQVTIPKEVFEALERKGVKSFVA